MKIHPVKPLEYIPQGPRGAELSELDFHLANAITKSAHELARVLDHEPTDFWQITMPQQLASILERYERAVGIAGALTYLQQYGSVTFCPKDGSSSVTVPTLNSITQ